MGKMLVVFKYYLLLSSIEKLHQQTDGEHNRIFDWVGKMIAYFAFAPRWGRQRPSSGAVFLNCRLGLIFFEKGLLGCKRR